ncbi:hypothetical protein P3T39_000949 [Kitasatospora sp. GP82]|nr:hypothetical protein [Kitasatospora sp. GP82]
MSAAFLASVPMALAVQAAITFVRLGRATSRR